MPASSSLSERQLRVGSFAWNLAEVGEGTPVLLLHGWPDAWRLWRHQLGALAEAGCRAVAPDLPGLGRSDRPARLDGYRLERVAVEVVHLLDALGIGRFSVVGHDWGAALAWVLAALEPDRVDRLAAVSVGHPAAFAAAGLERQLADLARPGALAASLSWYRANFTPESFVLEVPPAPLPPVRCPTMGVWSSGDVALTEEQMTGSARFVEGGRWRYERVEGVDHWIPVHAADRLNELLLEFLQDR